MRWTKMYNSEWIDGSIRIDLTPAERSVWSDFLALAGLSRRGGYIERSQGIPYTINELSNRLIVGADIIQSTIDKCVKEGRITIDETGTMFLTNWHNYQDKPDKIIAKESSIAKGRQTKQSTLTALRAMTRAINNLIIATQKLDGKIRYVPNPTNPHNEVVDIADGTVFCIEQEIIDKKIAEEIMSHSDDKGV